MAIALEKNFLHVTVFKANAPHFLPMGVGARSVAKAVNVIDGAGGLLYHPLGAYNGAGSELCKLSVKGLLGLAVREVNTQQHGNQHRDYQHAVNRTCYFSVGHCFQPGEKLFIF